jgi:hypothetical protein
MLQVRATGIEEEEEEEEEEGEEEEEEETRYVLRVGMHTNFSTKEQTPFQI